MDARQLEFLTSKAGEIAGFVSARKFADSLVASKLVTKEIVDNIMLEVSSNFCQMIRLITAIQSSNSKITFDEFLSIIDEVHPELATSLREVEPKKKNQSPMNMFDRFRDKFSSGNYPLGMQSNIFASTNRVQEITSQEKSEINEGHESQREVGDPKDRLRGLQLPVGQISIEPNDNDKNTDCRSILELSQNATSDLRPKTDDSAISFHPYVNLRLGTINSRDNFCEQDFVINSNVLMSIARDGPREMSIRRATTCHNNLREDYKMTSCPRGKCLIVNNIDFEYDMFPTRKGSDEDANRFDQIFQQLGYETVMARNLTSEQMKDIFRELAAACKHEHDSLFVIILSHGSESGIYGTDGIEIHLENHVMSQFNDLKCIPMIGKPKVFIIQACRGKAEDFGSSDATDAIKSPSMNLHAQLNQCRSPVLSQVTDAENHARLTDTLLVFSCQAGFVSVRNETAGSWLGVALAYYIMTEAHERDFLRILNLVSNDINQRRSMQGHYQSIELKALGWTKNLYFNPGIYI